MSRAELAAKLRDLEKTRKEIEKELESSRARREHLSELVQLVAQLREACRERARIWEELMEEVPDLMDYVIGPSPWANDAFARGIWGSTTPEDRSRIYRQLGLRVEVTEDGTLLASGVFGSDIVCLGNRQPDIAHANE